MEIFEAKKMADETLTGIDDNQTILKPNLGETVGGDDLGVSVEKTEVSVAKMVQDDKENELKKNNEHGEEGVFGNLVGGDDDEGMNVNCSENGASMAMDVDGSVIEGNVSVLVDEHDEKASGDPMDIKNNENGSRGDEGGKLVENEEEFSVEESERVEKDEDEEEEEDHSFVVGDFVWGKIKSHPWWPGQIYDPSDASDNAARLKHKGRILVAHFGDGSFSWCSPSQLKPFIDHFPEMSKQSDSKKFMNAVQTALGEVSRLVEGGLMCKCQTVNRVHHVGVVNRGIKEGVPVPNGNTVKVLMDRIEPVGLLSMLKDSAAMDPGAGLAEVELTLLKSFLSAFYSKKGGYLLVKYHDPMCIEGLEDELRSGVVGVVADSDSDINGPSESIDNVDDKLYQRRKQKSVAELLLREDEPKIKKPITVKEGRSGKRKRKALVVSVTPESDHESGGGSGGVEEETMSPRQRKKSKYLSPPYLSPVGSGRLSVLGSGPGLGSFKESKPKVEPKPKPKPEPEPEPDPEFEPKPELEKVPETAAKHLEEDSLKKSSGKKTRQTRGIREGSDSQEEPRDPTRTVVNVNKVLNGLLRVALDPTSFKKKNLPTITDFVSSYRSSIFKEGSRDQTDGEKDDQGTSDLEFIKQKLESMIGMVQGCEETEMSADVKASLEGGIQEVLEKVGIMKGE